MCGIVVLLNGLTDVPLEELGGKTPLEKASHPTLDQLSGPHLLTAPQEGGHPHALLALLGIDGRGCGRAAFEAEAIGHPLQKGQEAFSVRFVSMGGEIVVDLSDQLLTESEAELLCAALSRPGWRLFHLRGPEALLIVDRQSDLPAVALPPLCPTELVGRRWDELLPSPTLRGAVQSMIEQLAGHEINRLKEELEEPLVNGVVLSEGGGALPWLPKERSEIALYTTASASIGIAKSLGLPLIRLPEELRKYDHLARLLEGLPRLTSSGSILIFELSYLWESTYRGDLLEKVKTIEWLDKHWLAPLLAFCRERGVPLAILPLRNVDIRTGKVVGGALPLYSDQLEPPKALADLLENLRGAVYTRGHG